MAADLARLQGLYDEIQGKEWMQHFRFVGFRGWGEHYLPAGAG